MVRRLLVIDDADDVSDLIGNCARRTWPGVEVDWYDPVARGKPDADFDWSAYEVIFLDCHVAMGGKSGHEWLRDFAGGEHYPPVIVLTDQVSEESSAMARRLGAKYYVDKHDISPRLLANAVEAVSRKETEVAQSDDAEDVASGFESADWVSMNDIRSILDTQRLPAKGRQAPEGAVQLKPPEAATAAGDSLADSRASGTGESSQSEISSSEIDEASILTVPFNANIPGFRLVRLLSSSASSSVLLAKRDKDGRSVVLKVISTDAQDNEQMLKRFMREQAMLAKLRHPNVVRIFSGGVTKEAAFIAMEYFPGGDLRKRIDSGIDEDKVLETFRGIAKGLGAAHDVGIVHRDIKPANILIRKDDSVAIADFGISKSLGASTAITVVGFVMGTPFYISPEQINGESADKRSDLYSLGIILFELLTGERPYPQTRLPALLKAHTEDPIPQLPEEHGSMQFVIEGLLAKKPEDRFQSVQELLVALGPE
jgi:DNA-binding response OmpR family regulator